MTHIFLRDLRPLNNILEIFSKIYQNNSSIKSKYYRICDRYGTITVLIVKCVIGGYVMCGVFYAAPFGIASIIMRKALPPLSLYLPGDRLLIISTICNYAMFYPLASCPIACDLAMCIVLINNLMLARILIKEVEELQFGLENPAFNCGDVRKKLVNIILLHRSYNG